MARLEVQMPKMGESIVEATVLKWCKNIGDPIEMDEPIMEIATDKVDSEVPSPVDGKLVEIFCAEGDVIPVGQVIAILETENEESTTPSTIESPGTTSPESTEPTSPVKSESAELSHASTQLSKEEASRFYSPLVLNIARKEGIPMSELESVPGTGRNQRVTKKDILAYLKGPRKEVTTSNTSSTQTTSVPATPPDSGLKAAKVVSGGIIEKTFSHSGEMEIIEMDRMRKMIAENMVYSKHVSPHVTSFVEADVTNLFLWRKNAKDEFLAKYGQKLTLTPLFLEAIAQALQENPMVNISLRGDEILVKKDINIGIAVALPSDNLIVPVIKNADRLNLVGLSSAVNDLADRARNNKLKLEELQGGTYTLSNVGTFGNVMGTPIIMQPQVAIMAAGAIRKKPAVIETPTGDFIGIRYMMFLSHSYDHRVVDGALGGRFVKRVATLLENFDLNREI